METTTPVPPSRSPGRRPVAVVAAVLLVASSLIVVLGAGSASATGLRAHRLRPIAGTFVDPGGIISDVTPAGDKVTFTLSGGTHWESQLSGETTYHGPGTFDPSTGVATAVLQERFTGSLTGVGSGHLDFVDWFIQHADGSGETDCFIVGGDGELAGTYGLLRFVWTGTAANGEVRGTISGFIVR